MDDGAPATKAKKGQVPERPALVSAHERQKLECYALHLPEGIDAGEADTERKKWPERRQDEPNNR